MASFTERFKELRERRGWSQEEISSRLGISRSTIAGYESDSKGRIPREPMLKKIALLFDVSVGYLLGSENNPNNNTAKTVDDAWDVFEQTLLGQGAQISKRGQFTPEIKQKLMDRFSEYAKFLVEEELRKKSND
jgi:transcriptional regulator with XRE-family HTH domain